MLQRTSARAARGKIRVVEGSGPTLATAVVDRLRSEIVRGLIEPGTKLRLEPIAERYGVGRTPLREACCRLASEGLVSVVDQRGFRVAPISRSDLVDLTRTRQQIECLALRASITRGDAAWEGAVRAAHRRLSAMSAVGRRPSKATFDDAWETEHGRLHAALLGACDSPWLLRFHGTLFEQSERYRRLAMSAGPPDRDVDGEHDALVTASLGRDAERASALLVEHIARTAERVLAMHPFVAEANLVPSSGRMSTK